MKTKLIILISLFSLFLLNGCNYLENRKYHGKTFKIRIEIQEGENIKMETWENANNVSYNKEDYVYSFYVNGKLVVLDARRTVIIEEQETRTSGNKEKGKTSTKDYSHLWEGKNDKEN